ncbi:MAG: putative succinate dehydrogenase, cytochrome b556 subunit [Variovorax sp.]|jgi:succinate dehydrogenase / fumarate reductase cytochrome b subunit|nr:putative succinate dehydrogenase, cytochrome b556 subunit [Variovorax sp.]
MASANNPTKQPRREFRNIHMLKDLPTYKYPSAAIVSILHRVSGAILFVFLPLLIWMLDQSIASQTTYGRLTSVFVTGIGIVPGWLMKVLALLLIWSYLHHFIAGLRHLWMDVSHKAVTKRWGMSSARAVLALSALLTVLLGAKLFGLY